METLEKKKRQEEHIGVPGMDELISVIVPVYKVEDYLSRCVDSILSQTYRNIEVILVDDGSPDKCGEICDRYAQHDPRVRVIHKENGGLSDARNAGIEIAQGQYISFIDSDDWVHPEFLESLYQLTRSTDADIAASDFMRTSTENLPLTLEEETVYQYSNLEALKQYAGVFYVQMVVSWGKIYKKQLFEGVRFPVGRVHEDEFTTHKVIYKAKRIVFTTRKLLYYWQRQDSIMGSRSSLKNQLDTIDALLERSAFFESIGLDDLSGLTYKKVFFILRKLFRNMEKEEIDNGLKQKFWQLKSKLRNGNHDLKFKVFYETYFFSPLVFNILHDKYLAIKKIFRAWRK